MRARRVRTLRVIAVIGAISQHPEARDLRDRRAWHHVHRAVHGRSDLGLFRRRDDGGAHLRDRPLVGRNPLSVHTPQAPDTTRVRRRVRMAVCRELVL